MTLAVFVILLLVISLLIFFSALFSGLETALFSLKPHQLERLERNHPTLREFIGLFRASPRRVLNLLLFGDGLVKVPLIVLCLVLLWQNPFAKHVPYAAAAGVVFAVVVVVCDLVPKLFALSVPYRLSFLGAHALRLSIPLLDLVGQALENFSAGIVDLLTPVHLRTRARLSDAELETLVEISAEQGALHGAEAEMIQEIMKLGDKTAKDCMTPRVDTFMLADDLTNEDAIAALQRERRRRIPVYADTPDQVVGILDVKTFLIDPSEHYTETMIAPSFVPETMRALDLLKLFLTHAQGMAIVVDEFGGTEGIITSSDMVEEILGDAIPGGEVDLYIEQLDERRLLVSGDARLDDLSEYLGFDLEADGIDTIGGFVFNRLGYLPPSGTHFELPRLLITVRRASRKRIRELVLEKTTAAAAADLDSEKSIDST
jgi:putative hemolysin